MVNMIKIHISLCFLGQVDYAAWLIGIRDKSNSGAPAPVKDRKEKLDEHGSYPAGGLLGRTVARSTVQHS